MGAIINQNLVINAIANQHLVINAIANQHFIAIDWVPKLNHIQTYAKHNHRPLFHNGILSTQEDICHILLSASLFHLPCLPYQGDTSLCYTVRLHMTNQSFYNEDI